MIHLRFHHLLFESVMDAFSPGPLLDNKIRRGNLEQFGEESLCPRCDGTGNEIYFHYKRCRACCGSGVVQKLNSKNQ